MGYIVEKLKAQLKYMVSLLGKENKKFLENRLCRDKLDTHKTETNGIEKKVVDVEI